MAMSQRDRIVNAIEELGWTRDKHAKTGKYLVFRKEGPASPVRLFLGKSGALRHSAKGIVSDCKPVMESNRLALIERGAVCKAEVALDELWK